MSLKPRTTNALIAVFLLIALTIIAPTRAVAVFATSPHAAGAVTAATDPVTITTAEAWVWPTVGAPAIIEPYRAPPHRYGPGHRGIDIGLAAGTLEQVRAPATGVVAFVGSVAGRPLITIDHGDGLVTTLEPVASTLHSGDTVARGDPVGTVATGGHTAQGLVHFGVRLHGEYVNPLLLLGGIPRAVLVPCCS